MESNVSNNSQMDDPSVNRDNALQDSTVPMPESIVIHNAEADGSIGTSGDVIPEPVVPTVAKALGNDVIEDKVAQTEYFEEEPTLEDIENEDPDNIDPNREDAEGMDYSAHSKEELVEILLKLLESTPIDHLRREVEYIKVQFYKKHKADVEKKRKEFIEAGGELESFLPEEDPSELQIKDLFKKYRELKAELNQKVEAQKHENLKEKFKIIDEIKELVNSKESINQTFQEFRELQKRWRSIGLVPQQNMNDLWENYHHTVEMFYDFIKINQELRDLDFKRNLDEKIKICEKAEDLLLEPSIVKAFKLLQKYHEQWREVGPVSPEMRQNIWERFKLATAKINKKHQEYFEQLKDLQKKNLEQKSVLCEKIEEMTNQEISSATDWDNKSKEIQEIQKLWKTIGFAPKKDNNKIYLRFRNACDIFYSRKRDFFLQYKEVQSNNLQLKTDLCLQAEALKQSTDWKKTTEDLISLQRKWKETGPIPRKYSDALWKRFRTACDTFFKNKSEFFSNIDVRYDENMHKKQELIGRIAAYQMLENVEENFKKLKEFQREWAEIGFVAFKDKDEIQKKYREAINKLFDSLRIDEAQRKMLRFKNKIENIGNDISNNSSNERKLKLERDKYIGKLNKLQSDIVVWENNIGFFAKSKNAEAMIKEVNHKIDDAKDEMKLLEQKIRMIDNLSED
jgi:hypothetical protein